MSRPGLRLRARTPPRGLAGNDTTPSPVRSPDRDRQRQTDNKSARSVAEGGPWRRRAPVGLSLVPLHRTTHPQHAATALRHVRQSRSGVAVSDEALKAFNDLKLGKKYKYVIYKLNDDKTQIIVDSTSTDDSYDKFLEEFPENDCKYAVYDFEYEISAGEGKRSKIVFYQWSPDTASIRAKMVYASSKDALRRALNGVSSDIQGTDFSEVSYEAVLDKVSRGAGSH